MTSNTKLLRTGDLHCPVESDHIGHAREEEEHGDNPCSHAAAAAHHLPKTNQKISELAHLATLIVPPYLLNGTVHKESVYSSYIGVYLITLAYYHLNES